MLRQGSVEAQVVAQHDQRSGDGGAHVADHLAHERVEFVRIRRGGGRPVEGFGSHASPPEKATRAHAPGVTAWIRNATDALDPRPPGAGTRYTFARPARRVTRRLKQVAASGHGRGAVLLE